MRPEDVIREIHWEHEAHNEGVRRYRESVESSKLPYTDPGQKLANLLIPEFSKTLDQAFQNHWADVVESNTRSTNAWHWVLGMLESDELAVIAIKVVMYSLDITNRTMVAISIGKAVETQIDYHQWKAASADEAEAAGEKTSVAERIIRRYGDQVHRNTRTKWRKTCESWEALDWSKEDQLNIGMKILTLLIDDTFPDVFRWVKLNSKSGKKARTVIKLTEEIENDVNTLHEIASFSRPFLVPTIIQPQPWHRDEESGHIKGGYWHLKNPLFTHTRHEHTAADNDAASPEFLAAINQVQKTAWCVNENVLDFLLDVRDLIDSGTQVPAFAEVPADVKPPKLTQADWAMMSDDEKKTVKTERRNWHEAQESIRGSYTGFIRKLDMAVRMREFPEFYFPHFADFRGRLYPMPQDLNPQGDHIAKGLLQFAEAVPLGQRGLYWLVIHIANCYGKDKATYDDRELFVHANYSKLETIALNPMDHLDELSAMEEPCLFLAAMWDLIAAYELEDPTLYESCIPVAMDGVCNGMQILSLLGHDPEGAKKTNCSADPVRYDLYNEVADVIHNRLETYLVDTQDEPSSPEYDVADYWLHQWNQGKGRKVVKRAVMTTPYGVTKIGIADQLEADGHTKDRQQAAYMRDQIVHAVGTVTSQASLIMEYFQQCARVLAEHDITMSWITPNNLRVTQSYWKTKKKKVVTSVGEVILHAENQGAGLDTRKNALSAAPNVVHSLDAAMLQKVVIWLAANGITSTAMIHDSYGVHAGYVEKLHAVIREVGYSMFKDNWLTDVFHKGLQSICPEGVELPVPPEQGDFDVSELISAPYFFS